MPKPEAKYDPHFPTFTVDWVTDLSPSGPSFITAYIPIS